MRLQEAKAGTGFVVVKTKVPVIPVYIKGSGKAMPVGSGPKFGSKVDIFIGKPILSGEILAGAGKDRGYEGISDYIMNRVSNLKYKAELAEKKVE